MNARLVGMAAGIAALVGVVAPWSARAESMDSRLAPPYGAAYHETEMSCRRPNIAPRCSASSWADTRGRLDVAVAIDTGANGIVPGTAESSAVARVTQLVDLGPATATTFTAHIHVTEARVSSQFATGSDVLVAASAQCDGCPATTGGYAAVENSGDQTVSVTLLRGGTGSRRATFAVALFATAADYCDDMCLVPSSGKATASAHIVLDSVDLHRWGLGRPTRPSVDDLNSGSVVHRDSYSVCQPDCHDVSGERISGTAEPGMPVQLLDDGHASGAAYANDQGRWVVYVDLRPGEQRLAARANGPQGTATSSPISIQIVR